MRSLWSNKNGKDRKKSATLVIKPHRSKTYNIFLAFDCVLMQKGRHPMLLLFVLDQTDQRVLRCAENGIFTVFKRAFVFETTNKFCGRRLNRKPAMCSLIFNSNFRLFPIPIIEPFCDFERKYNFRFSVVFNIGGKTMVRFPYDCIFNSFESIKRFRAFVVCFALHRNRRRTRKIAKISDLSWNSKANFGRDGPKKNAREENCRNPTRE